MEPILEVPITLEHNWLKKDLTLKGLSRKENSIISWIKTIIESSSRKWFALSERLAKVLQAPIGTVLTLENLYPILEKIRYSVEVGVIPQYLGINAYMEINAAQDILQQRNLATSFMLILEKDSIPLLKETYRNSKIHC